MKYTTALLPLVLSAITLTSPVAATTLFDCPYTAMTQESLGLSFAVDADTSNCEDDDDMKSAIAELIKITVTQVSGHTSELGEVEIDLEGELCDETDNARRLRGGSRQLWWKSKPFWAFIGSGGICIYCNSHDDDKRNRVLLDSTLAELEQPLSDRLSDLATMIFSEDEESCLFGKAITVDVHFEAESGAGCN